MASIKWRDLSLEVDMVKSSATSNHLTKKARSPKKTPPCERVAYKHIKLENKRFINFESLVLGKKGGLKVRVFRHPPKADFDESKKAKLKPEQLLNIDPQIFEGELVFEHIQERLSSLFLKERPKKNHLEFLKKIQKTFEIKGETTNSDMFSNIEHIITQCAHNSDSYSKGLCFRVPLKHLTFDGGDGDLFDCSGFYAKLYIRSENFDFFGKNLFDKYNMNTIIKTYSPIRRNPDRPIEGLFKDFFETFFEDFQARLFQYGQSKMWIKETVIEPGLREPSESPEVDYKMKREFYQVVLDNPWLLQEMFSTTRYTLWEILTYIYYSEYIL